MDRRTVRFRLGGWNGNIVSGRRQFVDRTHQLLAMAQQHAHALEVLVREFGQYLQIDGIVLENLGVLAQAQVFEPLCRIAYDLNP